MRGTTEPITEGKINQRRKNQHVRDGDRVKRLDSHSRIARRKVAGQAIRSSRQAENDHDARQTEAK